MTRKVLFVDDEENVLRGLLYTARHCRSRSCGGKGTVATV